MKRIGVFGCRRDETNRAPIRTASGTTISRLAEHEDVFIMDIDGSTFWVDTTR